jgi:hypothetical protein
MDSSLYQRSLAAEVASAIERADQSTLSVSNATGIPRTTLIRRLNGNSPFTVTELADIATFIDMSPVELLRAVDTIRAPEQVAS